MKNHTKVYFDHFDLTGQEFIECEICGKQANDIHHLVARGMGGVSNNRLDIIENLQAICRVCHDRYGDSPNWFEMLVQRHALKLRVSFTVLLNKIKAL